MGFNFAFGALAETTLADLAGLGVTTTGETVTGDTALLDESVHATVAGDQLVLVCRHAELLEVVQGLAAGIGRPAAAVVLGSTSDTHALWLGDGDRERLLVMENGEELESTGGPWPEEEAALAAHTDGEWVDAEEAMGDAFARVTGVTVDDLFDMTFHELDLGELAGSVAGGEAWEEEAEEVFHPVADGTWSDLLAARVSGKVVAALCAVAVAVEVVFGVLALAGEDFGFLVPHLVFAVLAALTAGRMRMIVGALLWLALSAAINVANVGTALNRGSDHEMVLTLFLGFLVVLIGALFVHAWRMRKVAGFLGLTDSGADRTAP